MGKCTIKLRRRGETAADLGVTFDCPRDDVKLAKVCRFVAMVVQEYFLFLMIQSDSILEGENMSNIL